MRNCFKMFGTHKVLCAITLALVMGFSMTACDNGGGGNTDYGDGTNVTTVAQLSGFLSEAEANTADNPISVKINMDIGTHWMAILATVRGAERYVALDLSGSTGTSTNTGELGSEARTDSGIVSVTLPNTLTSIGNRAFYYSSSLTSITIPESVTSIGDAAFYYSSSLTSITIPESVTSIGGAAFFYCSSLTSITIPKNITTIGYGAFAGCSSLNSVTFAGTITSDNFSDINYPFPGDLRVKYLANGTGTYTTTRTQGDDHTAVWTKQ